MGLQTPDAGCQAWAWGWPHPPGRTPGSSHLALGLPRLMLWGLTRAPGCSPRTSESADPTEMKNEKNI